MDGVDIPEHVYDTIKSDMAKHGYTNNDITVRFITRSLKRNKLSKYYDNIMLIYCKLKNVNPPTIKYSEYEVMIKMFKQVDAVYEDKFKPKNRINSLRYSLVMFKLFIIIGKLGHARSLKLLKDYKILKEQFNIIDKIFNHLGWKASKVNTKKYNYRFCQEDGCNKRSSFNTPDQIKSIYCKSHAKEGMIDVRNKRCQEDECNKIPSFNSYDKTTGIYCASHAKEGMIDVIS